MELKNILKIGTNNKKLIVLDFGESCVKLAYLEAKGNKHVLLNYAIQEFNPSQKTAEQLSSQINELIKASAIKTKTVAISISDPECIFVKKISLPLMPRAELLDAMKWQLKGEFTFDTAESISDLEVIREYTDNEGSKKIELFCIFAKREIMNKYLLALAACGLVPTRISTKAFDYGSILNLLPASPKLSAILHIGNTHSYMVIYQNNKPNFIRTINFSVAKFSASLESVLATDKGKIEINSQKARQLIQQYGVVLDESILLEGSIKVNQIIPLMRPQLETLVTELGRSVDFFTSEYFLTAPEVVYLTGGGANIKNLDKYLAQHLKIKVQQLSLPDSLEINNLDAGKFALQVNQLSGAIGLGLSCGGINLLPPEIRSQKLESIEQSTLRVLAVTIVAVFIFSWSVISFQIQDYKKRLTIAKVHLQSVGEVKTLKQAVDLRESFIGKIHQGKVPSGGLLKLIGVVIPPTIILNEFDFDQPSHLMHLEGVVSASQESAERVLTGFMGALENSKFILAANLLNSNEVSGVASFEIECVLAK